MKGVYGALLAQFFQTKRKTLTWSDLLRGSLFFLAAMIYLKKNQQTSKAFSSVKINPSSGMTPPITLKWIIHLAGNFYITSPLKKPLFLVQIY